jgi:flagellar motor switch protein FliN/FliY
MDKSTITIEKQVNIDVVFKLPLLQFLALRNEGKSLEEAIEYSLGSLIVLSGLIEEPVELYLNHRLIAKGDAVIVDGSFGVRITEITEFHKTLSSYVE